MSISSRVLASTALLVVFAAFVLTDDFVCPTENRDKCDINCTCCYENEANKTTYWQCDQTGAAVLHPCAAQTEFCPADNVKRCVYQGECAVLSSISDPSDPPQLQSGDESAPTNGFGETGVGIYPGVYPSDDVMVSAPSTEPPTTEAAATEPSTEPPTTEAATEPPTTEAATEPSTEPGR